MHSITLKITSKLPPEHKGKYSGGCLTPDNKLYFGWRGPANSNLCFSVGNAVQKAMLLLSTANYDEVILDIDAEFTETRKPEKLVITKETTQTP